MYALILNGKKYATDWDEVIEALREERGYVTLVEYTEEFDSVPYFGSVLRFRTSVGTKTANESRCTLHV